MGRGARPGRAGGGGAGSDRGRRIARPGTAEEANAGAGPEGRGLFAWRWPPWWRRAATSNLAIGSTPRRSGSTASTSTRCPRRTSPRGYRRGRSGPRWWRSWTTGRASAVRVGDAADRGWEHLLAAARAADPDPWRDRMRVTWQHQAHLLSPQIEREPGKAGGVGTIAIGRHSRRDEAALKELTATAQLDRLHPAMVIFFLEVAGDKPEALTMLRDAQRRRPGDFWLNHTLAIQLRSEPREAIPFYRAALALQPESPGLLLDLGKVLCESGQFDEAIAIYNRALRLKPDFAAAYNNLGVALVAEGGLRRVDRRVPRGYSSRPRLLVSVLQSRQGTGPPGAAPRGRRCTAGRQPAVGPPATDRSSSLAMRSASRARADEAIAAYREAIRLNPNSADTYNSLGGVLSEHKRDYDGAIAAFRRAIELQPQPLHVPQQSRCCPDATRAPSTRRSPPTARPSASSRMTFRLARG